MNDTKYRIALMLHCSLSIVLGSVLMTLTCDLPPLSRLGVICIYIAGLLSTAYMGTADFRDPK